MQLRVAQKTGGTASKVSKIKGVRKDIARVLTVYNQTQKAKLREFVKNNKFVPKDLRHKKTRAMRRSLSRSEVSPPHRRPHPLRPAAPHPSSEQAAKKTERQKKRLAYFPARRFAVKAL